MAIFGFLITNAAGESAECGIESGTNAFFVRTTTGGAWGDWVQIGKISESKDLEDRILDLENDMNRLKDRLGLN